MSAPVRFLCDPVSGTATVSDKTRSITIVIGAGELADLINAPERAKVSGEIEISWDEGPDVGKGCPWEIKS